MKAKNLSIWVVLTLIIAELLFTISVQPIHAQETVHYVAPNGDCAGMSPCYADVQSAVDLAGEDDEIHVAAGRYTDIQVRPRDDITTTGFVTQVVYISKSITIRGGYTTTNWSTANPISYSTTLDAQGRGRGIYITGSISPTIEGLCITGGDALGQGGYFDPEVSFLGTQDAGGGIYIVTATAVISNNQIYSNTANNGGGISSLYGSTMLRGNIITTNTTKHGGGVFLYKGSATLHSNTIAQNIAYSDYAGGGGLYVYDSDVQLRDNELITNTTFIRGGGLYSFRSKLILDNNNINANRADNGGGLYSWEGNLEVSENKIRNNYVMSSGGGIFLYKATARFVGNIISNNFADADGGGVYSLYSLSCILQSNAVSDNSSKRGGGAYLFGAPVTLISNTISANRATDYGGGMYLGNSASVLKHNIMMSNTTADEGQGGGLYLTQSSATLTHNTIVSNTAWLGGGALLDNYSHATIQNNDIVANNARSGGGIRVSGSNITLTANFFTANRADLHGGGLYIADKDIPVSNNIFVNNWCDSGSAMYIVGASPKLWHNTIAGDGNGAGVYITAYYWPNEVYSNVTLANTILVNHATGIFVTGYNAAYLEATLWGADDWANGNDWDGTGDIITGSVNLWDVPTFVSFPVGDYHISSNSPAVDVGIETVIRTDIDNQPRPYHQPDIGADEYWPPGTPKYSFLPIILRSYRP